MEEKERQSTPANRRWPDSGKRSKVVSRTPSSSPNSRPRDQKNETGQGAHEEGVDDGPHIATRPSRMGSLVLAAP